MAEQKKPAMSVAEIDRLLSREFPQSYFPGCGFLIEQVGHGTGRVRRVVEESLVRPGGTLSGAKMMELADFAMYVAVFSAYGAVPLAVTTNLNINFLRKPEKKDLIADVRLMKIGRRLAVGEVTLYSDGMDDPVAHATSTYSVPPSN